MTDPSRPTVLLTAGAVAAGALAAGALAAGALAVGATAGRPGAGSAAGSPRVVAAAHQTQVASMAVTVGLTRTSVPLPTASPPATGWPALDAAVERIPGYRGAAPTTWRLGDRYGHAGSTLLPAEAVWISPSVPTTQLDSVVRHEWSHVLQSRTYGGDTAAMVAALDAAFGGTGARGVDGVENAADCMALELGATWTHYTPCRDPRWRAAAATLLAGHRL